SPVRAAIQPEKDRKVAAGFRLADASGKSISLSTFHGKVILLDFWATECGGCKAEIPWFIEFERVYKSKGLDVIGVSMDVVYEGLKDAKEGWSKVKPFVQTHGVNYPIVMGNNQVLKSYNIDAFPTTYLIDKAGRIAATYVGVVDKANVEGNIKMLIEER
ncbi:MAG: TlpA family protein disulfide reductase, partial [Acidobacteriia bacterium]|nr:TlpA family protein disulfide reductase [Terriglobia bacterium]